MYENYSSNVFESSSHLKNLHARPQKNPFLIYGVRASSFDIPIPIGRKNDSFFGWVRISGIKKPFNKN